MGAPDDLFL